VEQLNKKINPRHLKTRISSILEEISHISFPSSKPQNLLAENYFYSFLLSKQEQSKLSNRPFQQHDPYKSKQEQKSGTSKRTSRTSLTSQLLNPTRPFLGSFDPTPSFPTSKPASAASLSILLKNIKSLVFKSLGIISLPSIII